VIEKKEKMVEIITILKMPFLFSSQREER